MFNNNTKSLIKKCKELGDLFLKMGIEFKHLALSLEENKPTPDIKEFIEKRCRAIYEVQNED